MDLCSVVAVASLLPATDVDMMSPQGEIPVESKIDEVISSLISSNVDVGSSEAVVQPGDEFLSKDVKDQTVSEPAIVSTGSTHPDSSTSNFNNSDSKILPESEMDVFLKEIDDLQEDGELSNSLYTESSLLITNSVSAGASDVKEMDLVKTSKFGDDSVQEQLGDNIVAKLFGDWYRCIDHSSSQEYFWHRIRNEVTWEPPTDHTTRISPLNALSSQQHTLPNTLRKTDVLTSESELMLLSASHYFSPDGSASAPRIRLSLPRKRVLPADWHMLVDSSSQRRYYWNATTGERAWIKPTTFGFFGSSVRPHLETRPLAPCFQADKGILANLNLVPEPLVDLVESTETDVCVVKTEILLDMVSPSDISPPPPPPPPPPIESSKDNTSTSASDLEPVCSTVDIRSAALALASELAMAQAEQEAEAAVISSAAVSVATLAAEKSARSMVEAVAMGIRMRLQTLSPTLKIAPAQSIYCELEVRLADQLSEHCSCVQTLGLLQRLATRLEDAVTAAGGTDSSSRPAKKSSTTLSSSARSSVSVPIITTTPLAVELGGDPVGKSRVEREARLAQLLASLTGTSNSTSVGRERDSVITNNAPSVPTVMSSTPRVSNILTTSKTALVPVPTITASAHLDPYFTRPVSVDEAAFNVNTYSLDCDGMYANTADSMIHFPTPPPPSTPYPFDVEMNSMQVDTELHYAASVPSSTSTYSAYGPVLRLHQTLPPGSTSMLPMLAAGAVDLCSLLICVLGLDSGAGVGYSQDQVMAVLTEQMMHALPLYSSVQPEPGYAALHFLCESDTYAALRALVPDHTVAASALGSLSSTRLWFVAEPTAWLEAHRGLYVRCVLDTDPLIAQHPLRTETGSPPPPPVIAPVIAPVANEFVGYKNSAIASKDPSVSSAPPKLYPQATIHTYSIAHAVTPAPLAAVTISIACAPSPATAPSNNIVNTTGHLPSVEPIKVTPSAVNVASTVTNSSNIQASTITATPGADDELDDATDIVFDAELNVVSTRESRAADAAETERRRKLRAKQRARELAIANNEPRSSLTTGNDRDSDDESGTKKRKKKDKLPAAMVDMISRWKKS